jgi:RNA polymerase sigma-70 factor (ECF subfamily)
MTSPPLDVAVIYRDHGDMVRRRIRRFYGQDEAEDVLQEIFVRLMSTRSTWRGESALVTWLYQVTTRHCLNRLRDTRRRRGMIERHGEPDWSLPIRGPAQEAGVFLRELWRDLDEELAMVGVYYFVDDMSHAAIADVMGVSRRTVGNRVNQLRHLALARAGGTDARA